MDGKIESEERDQMIHELPSTPTEPPKFGEPVTHFYTRLEALNDFFKPDAPPVVHMRSKKKFMIKYGFADASGSGFGSTFTSSAGIN